MANPNDFFELDFLDVEAKSSGDAIAIRVGLNGVETVSVVDGGYSECGDKIVEHIKKHYDNPTSINHVVLTHPDGDHAAGLKKVLETFTVQRLWMNRPWEYVEELLPYYPTYNDPARLRSRLKKKYPHVRDLEEIAEERGILIEAPLQGAVIGHFIVVAPSRGRLIDLIIRDDDKAEEDAETASETLAKSWFFEALSKVAKFVSAAWGVENLPDKDTSPRNEMSVIQFANIGENRILLTGDAGREGLGEFIEYAPLIGVSLPGIDRFQVPHHGSRRNVSSEVLDLILGKKNAQPSGTTGFSAIISAAAEDEDHPKKAVVRAMIHRGGKVITTQGADLCSKWNTPSRDGWTSATPVEYPTEQEE